MSRDDDDIAPDAVPDTGNDGLRRINKVPLYMAFAIVAGFLVVLLIGIFDRMESEESKKAKKAQQIQQSNESMVDKLAAGKKSGLIDAARPPVSRQQPEQANEGDDSQDITETEASTYSQTEASAYSQTAKPDKTDYSALLSRYGTASYRSAEFEPEDEMAQQIRQQKAQLFQQAVSARTKIDADMQRNQSAGIGMQPPMAFGTTAAASQRNELLARVAAARQRLEQKRQTDPTAAYQQRLAALQGSNLVASASGMGGMGMGNNPTLLPDTEPSANNNENAYAAFDNHEASDRWQLQNKLQAPRSPYELRAGFILPAVMISGINSDLPGQISAQVAHNVFDTATGRYLLIPQGTRLLGSYENDVMFGQSRVLIAWQRLIFPDGKALDLGSMPGADSAGYSGFKDRVNNHYARLFGNAFLMSGITAAITISQDKSSSSNTNKQRASDALSESMGQVFGNAIAQLIAKNLNIAPTLEIRPGYRFNVIVTKDLVFPRPYQAFDYSAR